MTDTTHKTVLPNRVGATARRFAADRSGTTAIECAIMTFIAVTIMVVITQLGGNVTAMYGRVQAIFAH
jgi:Flp pilus assembly pilin Flp